MNNILDHIVLTPAAAAAWCAACARGLTALQDKDQILTTIDIGSEEAYEQPDGRLLITCRIGNENLNLFVDKEHWSHAN